MVDNENLALGLVPSPMETQKP
jgi:hypothetical protein